MPRAVLFAAVALWAALLSGLGLWKYAIFRADVDDGIFTQVLLSFGSGFSSTVEGGFNHLLVHCSPILIALVPFVRATGDARALIVAQAILSSLVAFPVYAIARRRVAAWPACAIAAISLCYPVLWAASFTDFHENAFVPVLCATLAWALDARRMLPALLASVALCATKEDQFVLLAMNAAIVLFAWPRDRARRSIALAMFAPALIGAAIYFGLVHGVLHAGPTYWSLHFYNWHRTAPSPLGFAPPLSPLRPLYLLWALLPLAFVPLRSRLCLLAIPGFIEVLASHEAITISLGTHYVAAWLGYLLAAFAAGAGDLWSGSGRPQRRAFWILLALCALTLIFHDPMERRYFLYRLPDAHDARLDAVLAALPRAHTVGAEDQIFAHLANRRHASIDFDGQTYFVYDRSQYSPHWANVDGPAAEAALRSRSYRVRSDVDGIVVLERAR